MSPYPLTDKSYPELLAAHQGEITKMICSHNGRFLFTGGVDGSIFIFKIGEKNIALEQRGIQSSEEESKDATLDKKNNIEKELAEVVLVNKEEMEEWKLKQEKLNKDLNTTRKKVEMAQEDTKNKVSQVARVN